MAVRPLSCSFLYQCFLLGAYIGSGLSSQSFLLFSSMSFTSSIREDTIHCTMRFTIHIEWRFRALNVKRKHKRARLLEK
jgi:hypothetical protein